MKRIDKQEMLDMILDAKREDPETGEFAEWLAEYLAKRVNKIIEGIDPCDVCAYNPPSSMDGKPCSLCPTRGKMEG